MKQSIFSKIILLFLFASVTNQSHAVLEQRQAIDLRKNQVVKSFCSQVPRNCPEINLTRESHISDNRMVYSVSVEGVDPKIKPTYKWTYLIDRKEEQIKAGQATPRITIENVDLIQGITVRVEIGGLPKDCPNEAEESTIS